MISTMDTQATLALLKNTPRIHFKCHTESFQIVASGALVTLINMYLLVRTLSSKDDILCFIRLIPKGLQTYYK